MFNSRWKAFGQSWEINQKFDKQELQLRWNVKLNQTNQRLHQSLDDLVKANNSEDSQVLLAKINSRNYDSKNSLYSQLFVVIELVFIFNSKLWLFPSLIWSEVARKLVIFSLKVPLSPPHILPPCQIICWNSSLGTSSHCQLVFLLSILLSWSLRFLLAHTVVL